MVTLSHRSRVSTVLLALTLVLAVATPALAATSPCGLSGSTTEDPADTVKGTANGNCSGSGRTISEMRMEIQEQVGPVWNTRDTEVDNPGTTLWTQIDTTSCFGHGTDQWRTKSILFDSAGDDKLLYFPSVSGVSITCST